MKQLLLILSIIFLISCRNDVGENTHHVSANGITYYKDSVTGLCFGKIENSTYYSFIVTSITCVPCDSLKKIGIR